MVTVITSTDSFFTFYAKAYLRSVGVSLSLNFDNYQKVIKEHFDYPFIKDMLSYIEDKTENDFLEIKENLNKVIEENTKGKPVGKVSLMEQIKSEGYSYDFSSFEPLPNSIIFS
jgi:hypothetical protein